MVIRGMKGFKLKVSLSSRAPFSPSKKLIQAFHSLSFSQVYPPEAFDMGAEFLKDLATCFAQTHGAVLKIAYVDVLLRLIHPIANVSRPC